MPERIPVMIAIAKSSGVGFVAPQKSTTIEPVTPARTCIRRFAPDAAIIPFIEPLKKFIKPLANENFVIVKTVFLVVDISAVEEGVNKRKRAFTTVALYNYIIPKISPLVNKKHNGRPKSAV